MVSDATAASVMLPSVQGNGYSRYAVSFLAIVLLTIAPFCGLRAQTNRFLSEGNKLYNEQRYDEATANYMKALQKDPNNATGLFNLGSALYQKKQFDSSRKIMSATANAIKDKGGKAAANYNIGNTYMAQKKWDDAITAYKNTLRNNPTDADAKYNLSYAEAMKKKEDKNGGGKNDKQDQNKDKKKDQKQDQKQDKQDKDKQDKQDGKGDDKDKKDQQDKDQKPQGQPSKLTQQQADQLLNALQQEEKKLQDKLKKEKGIPVKLDKDW